MAAIDDRWHLNHTDRAQDISLNQDFLTAHSKSGNWQGCRVNKGIKRDRSSRGPQRYYFEVRFSDKGLARVGWSHGQTTLDLGMDSQGWGYGGTAKKSNSRDFKDYGRPFGEKFDIVGCIIDMNTGEMSFSNNGKNMGVAFKLDARALENNPLYPTICVKNAGCEIVLEADPDGKDYKPADCKWVSEAPKSCVEQSSSSQQTSRRSKEPLALIIEPSRELAEQTNRCIETFSRDLQLSCLLLTGGNDSTSHVDKLKRGVDIVIATPGKLDEITRNKLMSLNQIRFFILDEADGLLQQGHKNLVTRLHSQIPTMFSDGRRLQTVMCSATLHNFEVKNLAERLMYFPMWIDLKGEDTVPDTVHHIVFRVDPKRDKTHSDTKDVNQCLLDGIHDIDMSNPMGRDDEIFSQQVKLMKQIYTKKAIDAFSMDKVIIFCRTKLDCDNLEQYLTSSDRKYTCVCLHADRSPAERTDNLAKFKSDKAKFLICTDVAARGIDIKGVPYVIQVTLPDQKENYLHRIGRVGRADRMGLAISLVSSVPEKVWFHSNCRNNRNCSNTNLTSRGGCCIWYNELEILGGIEDHLRCTIPEIGADFKLQVSEFDGRVVYGSKRLESTYNYKGHVSQLQAIVEDLSLLEARAQLNYLKIYCKS